MNASVYRIIETALELDQTLEDGDREAILAVCRRPHVHPADQAAAMPAQLLTLRQVGELFQISRTTIWRMTREGHLKPLVIGGVTRFRREDVDQLIATRIANGPAVRKTGSLK